MLPDPFLCLFSEVGIKAKKFLDAIIDITIPGIVMNAIPPLPLFVVLTTSYGNREHKTHNRRNFRRQS
jgi:hypothetical protein